MRLGALVLAATLCACVQSHQVTCGDGRICAPGDQCDDVHHRCLSTAQIDACTDHAEGDACSFAGVAGVCQGGTCEPLVCGDGVRTGLESCDGSDLGGADCTTAGFYEPDGLACSAFCTFDVSQCQGKCGDGIVNGPELCDGAPPPDSCASLGFDAGSLGCGTSCGYAFDGCARFGWLPEPVGIPNIYALAGTSATDLWVVGQDATNGLQLVGHFDGATWQSTDLMVASVPIAIAAAAPGDAWVVALAAGSAPAIVLHGINSQWTVVADIPAASYVDVWAGAPDAVAVATKDAGVLWWNGTSWGPLGTVATPLAEIRGTSASDLWAATTSGALLHWDGASWQPASLSATVTHIAAVAPDDVWVVGAASASSSVVAHWNGTAWTSFVDAQLNPSIDGYSAVVATAANDAWVATFDGAVRHYDGLAWSASQGSVGVTASSGGFEAIVRFGSELLGATFDGYVYRYRGQMFARMDTGDVGRANAIWSSAPGDTFVVDARGDAYHFDGDHWTKQVVDGSASPEDLQAVWGSGPSDVWASGFDGRVYRYDGSKWNDTMQAVGSVYAIWGSGPSDVWLFGAQATHYDGSGFTSPLTVGNAFHSASGLAANDIWAIAPTASGTDIYHWDGATWSPSHVTATFASIVEVAANDLFAVAGGNQIEHFDGATWTATTVPALDPLIAIAATAPDDVIAVSSSEIFSFDGIRWTPIRAPFDQSLLTVRGAISGVTASPDHIDILYSTVFGTQPVRRLIRSRRWSCRATETDCHDGVDDDCDGLVDQLDPDCPP